MLHSPAIADPSQRKVVNSYPIGTLGVGACALQFANRAQNQNEPRILAVDRHVEGWAEANVDKILDATAPSYRFTDPLVGSFSGRFLHEYCRTGSHSEEQLQSESLRSFSAPLRRRGGVARTSGSGVKRR